MTMTPRPPPHVSKLLAVALCAGALMVSGCDKSANVAAPAAPAPAPATVAAPAAPPPAQPVAAAPAPAAYTPPSADQLYEMVAPIALYPDKLVAQVLAGSTYPEQLTAADQWLAQNAALKAGPLADAAEQQPWDASVKSLTAFRPVLDQMAKNLPWTTALGQAYYNDPDDVMNAIQVMRQRASKAGKLQSTTRLRVATAAAPANYTPDPNAPVIYAGPPIIEPPPQFITIEPSQPDVVYVPAYDPQQIYGEPVPVYPGYAYSPPVYAGPNYSNAQIATAGVLSFGVGVVVGAALERHDWGWHAWGMHWGRPGGARAQPAFDRPAVVYNRSTYISRSNTVVNNTIRNTVVNGANPPQVRALQAQERQQQTQLEPLQRQQAQQGQRAQPQAQHAMGQQQQQARAQQEQQRQQQAQAQRQQTQQARAQEAQSQRQQQAQQRQARVQQQQQQQRPPQRQEALSHRAQAQHVQQDPQQQRAQAQQARNQQAQAQQQARQQQHQEQQRQQQQMQAHRQQQQAQQARAPQAQAPQQARAQQMQAQRQAQAQAQAHPPRAEPRQPHEGGGRPAAQHGRGERNQNQ